MTDTLPEELLIYDIISPASWNEKYLRQIKSNNTLYGHNFFWKSCGLWDTVEKHGIAGRATGDYIKEHIRFAFGITKARHTHSEYVLR
jgi:hypothetical protein